MNHDRNAEIVAFCIVGAILVIAFALAFHAGSQLGLWGPL